MRLLVVLYMVFHVSALIDTVIIKKFNRYPGYTGFLEPKGVVSMRWKPYAKGSVSIDYALIGVDQACEGKRASVNNACGIHIHAGTTCSEASEVKGHYFNTEIVYNDPWVLNATYKSAERGSLTVKYGYGYEDSISHAFVLHDSNGTRISCSIIQPKFGLINSTPDGLVLRDFPAYPGYSGPLSVSGEVQIFFDMKGQVQFLYTFSGVDSRCDGQRATVANACGIHFHEGISCDDASQVGGHFFKGDRDPWAFDATYQSSGPGVLTVNYGIDAASTLGHAFVLHDATGTRISCTILK